MICKKYADFRTVRKEREGDKTSAKTSRGQAHTTFMTPRAKIGTKIMKKMGLCACCSARAMEISCTRLEKNKLYGRSSRATIFT